MSASKSPVKIPRIGMTLGDFAGIGPEVVRRALVATGLAERTTVTVFGPDRWLEPWVSACHAQGVTRPQAGVGLTWVAVEPEAGADRPAPAAGQPTQVSNRVAFEALRALTSAAQQRLVDVMVTGPVPKAIFDHLADRPPGQTEFIARQLGAPRFAMMLYGPRLAVVPVTTHVALRDVAGLLSSQRIVDTGLAVADTLRQYFGIAEPRLAVCGLNPHAGEGGRLGDEEERIISPAIAALRDQGVDARGPQVADTVFAFAMAGAWDAVLCMYHDQALGPLKTVHFDDGSNLTCGLPVPRLSPDHGTAYDIAGQDRASAGSMIHTFVEAERIVRRLIAAGLPHGPG